MEALTISSSTGADFDVASLCWGLLLACITAACLWIQRRYPSIAGMGPSARVVAHVAIGYFGFGMMAFGAASAATRTLPVPGGTAWEGGVAVIGGLAACLIGGTTLIEHVVQVAALRRDEEMVPVRATAGRG
jgi:hypothetical protein